MLDFDKSCRAAHRDQARFHSMYQNSNEGREMKKMGNVEEFYDIIKS